ncbi:MULTISPECIES: very short patch repair endonuclease [unclassified Pseudomonas]|uniref:very short patch repair endonuclease n=1 Tax=unclassified Pseudomonas TaxID=196821 RepID=UPI000A1D7251|nr:MULTISPECIES: very short patch repair endonuclease [unclassified Pseudomonas]
MIDIVNSATRSRMMSGIRGKNTSPELLIRKALHSRGFRYRIHPSELPGKPDLLLPKFNAAIFIHGCFWHGHDCRYFKTPKTRTEFWLNKIESNKIRDQKQIKALSSLGWRVLVVWECAIRQMKSNNNTALIELISEWILSDSTNQTIAENH